MKMSLGNIQYAWPTASIESFYANASSSEADIIYIGESVCAKRQAYTTQDWLSLAREITNAGKQAVISTLGLFSTPAELIDIKRYCANQDILLEANDLGTINVLKEKNLPFVCGQSIKAYNAESLNHLVNLGMVRWVMPIELGRDALYAIIKACYQLGIRDKISIEIAVFGHVPLAYSPHCFTALSEEKSPTNCEQCCINYPSGRKMLNPKENSVFLLNGFQTLTGHCINLINELESMQGIVDIIRFYPESDRTLNMLTLFKKNLSEKQHHPLAANESCHSWYGIPSAQL